MTVKKLIEKLKEFDPSADALIWQDSEKALYEISSLSIFKCQPETNRIFLETGDKPINK